MKITKTQLLKIISEVLDSEEHSNLSTGAKNILMFLINPALKSKKFDSIEDFLSRTELLIGTGYDHLEISLDIDNQTAGFVNYDKITRNRTSDGTYCRPAPFEDQSTYMMSEIARSNSFRGYGIGRLLAFLSVCYINANNGTVTSDRNTSDYAGKELIDSLEKIGANKSESFDYVGWVLGSIHRIFYKNREFNTDPLTYHYDDAIDVKTSKSDAKRVRQARRLESEYSKELESLIRIFLTKHKPVTQKLTDDCPPSFNITFGSDNIPLVNIHNSSMLKDFLEKANNMTSEQLQNLLDSDERVQGYTFTLSQQLIDAGSEILRILNKSDSYDSEEFLKKMNNASNMFGDVYLKNVTEPGVGYRNINPTQSTGDDD